MTTTPLGEFKGIPDDFIRALNQRIRDLERIRIPVTVAVQHTDPANLAPSVQALVTGSRALATTYQNTGTTPMMVTVTLQSVASGGANFGQANVLTDAASPPTTVVATTFNGSATSTVHETISFWVLPGNYYRINVVTTTVVLGSWVEWT